jgi:hypothetical protein
LHKRRELSPESFKLLADEIRDIATISSKLWLDDHDFQERVRRIHKEMDHLDGLLSKRSFERLSTDKKEELRKSLLVSRDELMKSLKSAPCPTDRIQ